MDRYERAQYEGYFSFGQSGVMKEVDPPQREPEQRSLVVALQCATEG